MLDQQHREDGELDRDGEPQDLIARTEQGLSELFLVNCLCHCPQIKKLEQLDGIADRLEELWMSYNLLSTFAGIEQCSKLRCLFVGNNNISDEKELARLQVQTALP